MILSSLSIPCPVLVQCSHQGQERGNNCSGCLAQEIKCHLTNLTHSRAKRKATKFKCILRTIHCSLLPSASSVYFFIAVIITAHVIFLLQSSPGCF